MNTAYITTQAGAETSAEKKVNAVGVFAYGLIAYAIGVGSLFWFIFALAGFAPMGILGVEVSNVPAAVALNVALLMAFGVQHSIMARPWFKAWMMRGVPEAAERSTFVLATGLVVWMAILFWQPLGSIIWQAEAGWAVATLWTLFGLGWGYMLLASFAINHFDLFGLRQVYLNLIGKKYSPVLFQRRWMYAFSRHPLMAGILVGIWATPVMTLGQLSLAITFTAYIAVGLWFEERDLVRSLGDKYLDYMKDVGKFSPWF